MNKKDIAFGAKLQLARIKFKYYCQLVAPDFYKPDREYLNNLCDTLQDFYFSDDEVLIINIPPRHGKSRTAQLFCQWLLGHDNTIKIMTGSYNETLSTTFSKGVRNAIQEKKADKYKPIFNDVFPDTHIKHGDGSMNLWSLENGFNNYLATSPTGTATGFGATCLILDDTIKNAYEANNENILDSQFSWFTDTMLSRLESGGKIIVIMTRWHSKDLSGRILTWCKDSGKRYKHINLSAIQNAAEKKMLCSEVLSYADAMDRKKIMGDDIFSANYLQITIDAKGRLYKSFVTYDTFPENTEGIFAYCDTADAGKDYLCLIVFAVKNKEAFVMDILYTQESMEITESLTAAMLYDNNVNKCYIESNNGGKGFARNVRRILTEKYGDNHTMVKWFTQTRNKASRILTHSSFVEKHIYFPHNWKDRFPEFYDSMIRYQKEGKNKHDDAQDAVTGVAEFTDKKSGVRF